MCIYIYIILYYIIYYTVLYRVILFLLHHSIQCITLHHIISCIIDCISHIYILFYIIYFIHDILYTSYCVILYCIIFYDITIYIYNTDIFSPSFGMGFDGFTFAVSEAPDFRQGFSGRGRGAPGGPRLHQQLRCGNDHLPQRSLGFFGPKTI